MPTFALLGKIRLEGSKWVAGLKQAEKSAEGFSRNIANRLGGAIKASLIGSIVTAVAAAVAIAARQLSRGAKIRDMASKIGVTPERMQMFEYAASQSGATGEQVINAIKGLTKTQTRANEVDETGALKNPGLMKTFAKFGLTQDDMNKPAAALFQIIADRIAQGFNKKDLDNDLQILMEEAGFALIPVFKANLSKAMSEAATEVGLVTDENVRYLGAKSDLKTKVSAKVENAIANRFASGARNLERAQAFGGFYSAGPGAIPQAVIEMQRAANIERSLKNLDEQGVKIREQ